MTASKIIGYFVLEFCVKEIMFVLFCDCLLSINDFFAQVTIVHFQCDMLASYMKTYLLIYEHLDCFYFANVFVHVHNFFGK